MAVRLTNHVRDRLQRRGTSAAEVEEVLRSGVPDVARPGYRGVSKVFEFNSTWGDRLYRHKQVRIIVADESGDEVVVTVSVYYGEWAT